MERVDKLKAAVSAAVALLTALWGWFGWLIAAWVVCVVLDYLTGTAAALKKGEWSSARAREGLWHKTGAIAAVLVAGILDLVTGHLLRHIAAGAGYTVLLCPVVLVWYILTECGSILENAGRLGAVYPAWLTRAIAALKKTADTVGDAAAKGGENSNDKE